MTARKSLSFFLTAILLSHPGIAREGYSTGPNTVGRSNTAEGPAQTVINVNNFTVWVRGDGYHDQTVGGSWNGSFPKGTAGAIYSDGIMWGGRIHDGGAVEIRIGGNHHTNGTTAGAILTDNNGNAIEAEDPDDPSVRPYRVRPDFQTVDLTDDAANFFVIDVGDVTATHRADVENQYETDWVNWPWEKGAPYDDRDGNGAYEPDPDEDGIYGEVEVDGNGDTTYVEDIPGIPGAHQSLWTVYNDFDNGKNISFNGAPATGLEIQKTYWAYALDNPLGNTVFKKVQIIYKGLANTPSDANIEDMYIIQWSDPDLGQYTDDFLGSDTTLSLGYVYNSSNSDAVWDAWGIASPAAGYDFLQGPLLEGKAGQDLNKNGIDDAEDYAIWDLKVVGPGLINLPMTTFTFFAAGAPRGDPPRDYSGALEWYNLMRGRDVDGSPLLDHLGNVTQFELSGDPILGTGDLDGKPTAANPSRFPPGDRRSVQSTGPFVMYRGDTQEVVIALVGGAGNNFLQSVALLKFNDKTVQEAYDNLFDLPGGPPAADLNIVELDRELILEWESNVEQVEATETSNIKGYAFEGYNVYQFPSASAQKKDGKLLATFDLETPPAYIYQEVFDEEAGVSVLKPVQFGVNSGLTRYMRITTDAFTGDRLINGKTYHFAVTAYNQNMREDVTTHSLESPHTQSLRAGIPHKPDPQTDYPFSLDDTVKVTNVAGKNDAVAVPVILDPEAPNGEAFEIHYSVDTLTGIKTLDLIQTNVSPEDTVVAGLTLTENDTVFRFLHLGGWAITLADASAGVKSATAPTGFIVADYDEGTVIDENDYELRFTSSGSSVLAGPPGAFLPQHYWMRAPFEVWDLGTTESDADDAQIFACVIDGAGDREWNTEENARIGGKPAFDVLHITKVSYDDDPDSVSQADRAQICFSVQIRVIENVVVSDQTEAGDAPSEGSVLFQTFKGIQHGDVKTFSVGTVQRTATGDDSRDRIKKITVFPNPYLGLNTWETSRFDKYVTFSHLPVTVTVKIYTLSGVLVRTLTEEDKSDPASQFLRWDLRNAFNLPVASGIYIAHIDMPDLNEETVLKLAIVQEQQVLRSY